MKKIFFILFLITSFFISSNDIYSFGTNFWEIWFYTNIVENIDKVEKDIYKIDIIWNEWTKDKINNIIKNNCLNDNVSIEEIDSIVNEWKIDSIYWKISDSCKTSNWELTTEFLLKLISAIEEIDREYKNQAKEKTNQIFNIGSTWIYSDWIEWNSPFDLIVDLKNIDTIIFMEDSEIYDWNKDIDLNAILSDLTYISDEINKSSTINTIINTWNNYSNEEFNVLNTYNQINSQNIYSSYICSIDSSNSWLNYNSLYFINSKYNVNNNLLNNSWSYDNWDNSLDNFDVTDNPVSDYKKVNDNWVWPCDSIFCIDIEFLIYEHNLFSFWSNKISIEYLIKRSNEHLKKFTNTSLVWSKMTINNFELWLKDLNLADIFHIWIQVTKRPVPILQLEKENKVDESIYEKENQLKFYYESYWLDYERRNDLSLLRDIETDKQIALNSSLLNTQQYLKKIPEFQKYLDDKTDRKKLMWKIIENETKVWIIDDFEYHFKEIESFNWNIKDYIINLDKLISNMLKIPSDTWMN